jgi:hypothetical protein
MARKKITHPRAIKLNPDFVPCTIDNNDEYLRNGIFVFNITKLNAYIDAHPDEFNIVDIDVDYYYRAFTCRELNEEYVKEADLNRPVILAEIAPDRYEMGMRVNPDIYYERGYNLIDGHHRVAKAHCLEIKTLKAYIVRMEQHVNFLADGYEKYVEYWNDKLYFG